MVKKSDRIDVYAVVVDSYPVEELMVLNLSRHTANALMRALQASPDFDGVDMLEYQP